MKQRGIFEKEPGSGIWWICYFDQFGRKHREKAGTKSVAIKLYGKRKQQALEGKKLPETFRKPSVNSANWLRTRWLTQSVTSGRIRLMSLVLPA